MRTIRLFCDQPLTEGQQLRTGAELANYIGRVLRLRPGDRVSLFNGEGYDIEATIIEVDRKDVLLELGSRQAVQTESPLNVQLGQVVSRGDRMDFAVQKAAELGVSGISPLLSERCEVKLDASRREKRRGHWQQVAISACEQSGRARVPAVEDIENLDHWLESQTAELKLVLHPPEDASASVALPAQPSSVALLIGPEGGLTEEEVAKAEQLGFIRLGLGPRILRTETAPIAALTFLQCRWGDFPGIKG